MTTASYSDELVGFWLTSDWQIGGPLELSHQCGWSRELSYSEEEHHLRPIIALAMEHLRECRE